MQGMRTTSLTALALGALVLLIAAEAGAAKPGSTQTTTVRWGPIHLPAATSEGPGQVHNEIAGASGFSSFLLSLFTGVANYDVNLPCEDCYITGIQPNLVLADGTPLNYTNGGMLHHVVNVNFSRDDPTCPPGGLFSGDLINRLGAAAGGNERFYASGNERTVLELPSGYGYYVAPGDNWGLIYHLMNMAPVARDFYFEYTFTWVDRGASPVRPIWLDVDQCDDSEIVSPAGYSDTHWDWTSTMTGQVVEIGGHVHDYGISTSWENVTTNSNICTSVAGYAAGSPFVPVGPGSGIDSSHPEWTDVATDHPTLDLATYNGHISQMNSCEPFAQIQQGDQLRLHLQINRPDETDHDMGIMIGFIAEGGGGGGGGCKGKGCNR